MKFNLRKILVTAMLSVGCLAGLCAVSGKSYAVESPKKSLIVDDCYIKNFEGLSKEQIIERLKSIFGVKNEDIDEAFENAAKEIYELANYKSKS